MGSCAEKGLPRHLAAQLTRYITNDWELTAEEVIDEAHQRCNQENLIGQAQKSGVRALHAPVNTLHANWAYMTMAVTGLDPESLVRAAATNQPRWAEPAQRTTPTACSPWTSAPSSPRFIDIPCQIVTTGRRVRWRILTYNPWLAAFFRLLDAL